MTSKVFVGNLAFKTTDQQLVEAFQEFGKVKTGVVITRGRRSLGYGFVEFESPDAALQAVNIKNGNSFNERPIKVELATDNPVRAERPPLPSSGSNVSNTTASAKPDNTVGGGGGGDGAAPRRRRMRRRRVDQPKNGGPSDNKTDRSSVPTTASNPGAPASKLESDPSQPLRRRRRRRRTNENQNNEERVLSTTSVFVANLPFGVNDDELKIYFKEFSPKASHVVVTRNGRSRGYGFVEFNTEKDQKTAIESKNGQEFAYQTKNETIMGEDVVVSRAITVTPSYKTQEITTSNS